MKDEIQLALGRYLRLLVLEEDVHELDSGHLVLQMWSRCGSIPIFLNLSDERKSEGSLFPKGERLIQTQLIKETDRDRPPRLSAAFSGWVNKPSFKDRFAKGHGLEIRLAWRALFLGRTRIGMNEGIDFLNVLNGLKPIHDHVEQMVGKACLELFAGGNLGNEWRHLLLKACPTPEDVQPQAASAK